MNKRLFIMVPTLLLTCVLFAITTYTQRKLIHYEPKIKILFLKENVVANQKLSEDLFTKAEIDISLVVNAKVVKDYSEIEGLYAKDNMLKGQIAMLEQFDTKENLSIYEVEKNKETISIKIKSAENGMSYSIRNNTLVNVYVTIRKDLSPDFLQDNEKLSIGSNEYGYEVIQILENQKVMECFDIDGNRMSESDGKIIDTIILAVTHEQAKQINLLREIGVFHITGVG